MNRFTKPNYEHDLFRAIYCKLQYLEDIEEEIGIQLFILLKATLQGIWVKRNNVFYFFDNLIQI